MTVADRLTLLAQVSLWLAVSVAFTGVTALAWHATVARARRHGPGPPRVPLPPRANLDPPAHVTVRHRPYDHEKEPHQ